MTKLYRLVRFDLPLHFALLLMNWLPDSTISMRFRGFIASFFFCKCGSDLRLGRNITFYNPSKISIGESVYIAQGNWFSAGEKIVIEDEVLFGPNCIVASSNHTKLNQSFRFGPPINLPIKIGKGTWVGGMSCILAGSSVGRGTLIGAGTIVSKEVPDNVLYAGNPGKVIKQV